MEPAIRLLRSLIPDWARRLISPRNPIRTLWTRGLSWLAALESGFPARGMTVIGITGTDGKTTTAAMTGFLLERLGLRVAVATTAFSRIAGVEIPKADKLTTLSPAEMARFLRRCRDAGVTHLVLEVSSVALHQHRTAGIPIDVGVLLNVTPEELRFHRTMAHYRASKERLLRLARRAVVLNARDVGFARLAHEATSAGKRAIGFAIAGPRETFGEPAGTELLLAGDVRSESGGLAFRLDGYEGFLPMGERFNLENALAAIAAVRAVLEKTPRLAGVLPLARDSSWRGEAADAEASASEGGNPASRVPPSELKTFPGVPGRGERVNLPGVDFTVRIDYAITPAAFEALLLALRSTVACNGTTGPHSPRTIIVFGATGGGRDPAKRPVLGRLAAELADLAIVTEDESYDEPTEKIISEIVSGVPEELRSRVDVVPDRRAAIRRALELARPGDVISVNGMGAEASRNSCGVEIPWVERDVIRDEFAAIRRAAEPR